MQGPHYGKHYTDHFRIGGVNIPLDGSPQGKTAWLSLPYYQVPEGQQPSYAGYPIFTHARAIELIGRAWQHGWQVLAHANGDAPSTSSSTQWRRPSRRTRARPCCRC